MPFHIKKEGSIVDPSVVIYYKGNQSWSDNYDERKQYDTEEEATAELYRYGGTVISE
jgi:hypothetical protein